MLRVSREAASRFYVGSMGVEKLSGGDRDRQDCTCKLKALTLKEILINDLLKRPCKAPSFKNYEEKLT